MNRSTAARIAAHESWANTPDRAARSARGQTGLRARFIREARDRLGPDATDVQVSDAAESKMRAHFSRLGAASAAARAASPLAKTAGPSPAATQGRARRGTSIPR